MKPIIEQSSTLRDLPTDVIDRNPENPRLFFRPEELDSLLASIAQFGVQVPITVYAEGSRYVLIDGERRWRCANKLNLKRIPALVQPKPSPLNNLLLMFNIHALREQWDYLTIASKLPSVIQRYGDEYGSEPNEIRLSEITGLTRSQIRRCRYLLALPGKYMTVLLEELALPKSKQRLSEDFFIEMERSLKTVQTRVPNAILNMDLARDALIVKYRARFIDNVVDFRKLSKMATATGNLGIRQEQAEIAIREVLSPTNEVGIDEVFTERFELKYDERKVTLSIESIIDFLQANVVDPQVQTIGTDVREQLLRLKHIIDEILEVQDGI